MLLLRRVGGKRQLPGIIASEIVVAMGPWSKPFLDRLGLGLPMGVKCGYYRHYAAKGNAVLTRPVVDDHYGFVLSRMARRHPSGAEFARHDARSTPVQLARAEPLARALFRSPRASTKRLDRRAAGAPLFAAGHRQGAGAGPGMAQFRPCPSRPDVGSRDRAAAGPDDDRGETFTDPAPSAGRFVQS